MAGDAFYLLLVPAFVDEEEESDGDSENSSWLRVPPSISLEAGGIVKHYMQDLVKGNLAAYFPPVVLSYATGQRHGVDADGTGPGIFYARALAKRLDEAGVDTFSGLHVPPGTDWEVFFQKLKVCRALIVIVTPALFESEAFLKEISVALERELPIISVVFEGPVPPPSEQWAKFKEDESHERVTTHFTDCSFGHAKVRS